MEVSIQMLLSAVSFVVSTAVAISVFFYRRYWDRIQNCFEMFKIWNSAEIHEHRGIVFYRIEAQLKVNKCVDKGFSREAMKDLDHSIGILNHFVADLSALVNAKLIDRRLTKKLFWDTALKEWFEHFEEAYRDDSPFENSAEHKEWYRNNMKGLKERMDEEEIRENRSLFVKFKRYLSGVREMLRRSFRKIKVPVC